MKRIRTYTFVGFIVFALYAIFWTTNASERSFNSDSELTAEQWIKFFSVKDTIDDDTIKLKYPFRDNGNSPDENQNNKSPLFLKNPSNIQTEIEYDPKTQQYVVKEKVGKMDYRNPSVMNRNEYEKYESRYMQRNYWQEKMAADGSKDRTGSKLLDKYLSPKVNIPIQGMDKIFGTNTIDIKPQGAAELRFGINISKTENPSLPKNLQRSITFDFDEKIQMGVTGQIGDKMKLGINYNTEATFSFENQTTIEYTGHEDEIIQKIEAGNVSLPLNGTLIQGSSTLFGIKTQLKFGNLTVTSIASRQNGKIETIDVEGGASFNNYEISVSDYEADRHFFLSHYFKEMYDRALANLPIINSGITINKVEVWVTNTNVNLKDTRNFVGFMDLGEGNEGISNPAFVVQTSPGYSDNKRNNLYQKLTTTYNGIRNYTNIPTILGNIPNFSSGTDYITIQNAKKLEASEYEVNTKLGYISLNTNLNPDQVLAVAYQYTVGNQVYTVGELSDQISAPQTLILKLIRTTVSSPKLKNWQLMMKNIYSIGAYSINSNDFTLDIIYRNDKTGTDVKYVPDGKLSGKVFLSLLNLDNVNSQYSPSPDGYFDFITDITIKPDKGRIIFPAREPFGSYLKNKFGDDSASARKFIFQELYDSTQYKAKQVAEKNKFYLTGSYKGSGGSVITLNAMNIPEGTVKVTSGGAILEENVDYTVDYTLGRVTIKNESLMQSGQPIKVTLESNELFNLQTKTLLGTHLDYRFSDKLNLGATVLNLTEKPLTFKVGIGDEPISNTIWGVDASYNTDVPLLTRLVDMIPLIETKEMSKITFEGEFAYLVPGHSKVIKKSGTSFIDDFEGSQTYIDLKSPFAWEMSSTPQGQSMFPEAKLSNNLAYNFNRAKLAWYNINSDLVRKTSATPSHLTEEEQLNHLVREIVEQEIFPNRESQSGLPTEISVLNLAYYPTEKGPYNYDVEPTAYSDGINSDGTLVNPASRWAGITRKIHVNDFESSNIEFLEFWIMDPFVYDSTRTGGKLYFNLGNISEDILKDNHQSFENGLPVDGDLSIVDTTAWGRVSRKQYFLNAFDNNPDNILKQDVGLDGLSDDDERSFFNNYLERIKNYFNSTSSEAYVNAYNDPSSDNYHYYLGGDYNSQKLGILERYKLINGKEGNSKPQVFSGESYATGIKQTPDVEDVNMDFTLNSDESYYQYAVDISPDKMVVGQNYITNVVEATRKLRNNKKVTVKYYQFKIPINEPDSIVGVIQDFKSIRFVRMFMKGFEEPIVLRFAKLDLVRGEWRKYSYNMTEGTEGTGLPQVEDGSFDVSAVNIEENGTKTPVNYILPPGVTREIDPQNPQIRKLNEQAMLLKAIDLGDGEARAVYKNINMDVRQYKNLEMYVHAEAIIDKLLQDDDVTIFVRLGSDYRENFYEYELSLKVTPHGIYSLAENESHPDRYKVWPTENNIDILFEVLQQVKQERNDLARAGKISYNNPYRKIVDGKRVTVMGNPNLSNVRTLMIGIRNPNRQANFLANDDGMAKSVEVWVNELRLTHFIEDGGWAANARLQAQLADFATISLTGHTSKPGFGSIDKKVSERQKEDIYQYDVTAQFELGKFFPKKYNVNIPLYLNYSERFSNPQYDPLDPDILMTTTLKNPNLSDDDKKIRLEKAQDYIRRRGINFTNVRVGGNSEKRKGGRNIKTKPFYHISNWNMTYAYNELFSRNINIEYNLEKSYFGSINYNFNNSPKNIKPFAKSKLLQPSFFQIIKDFNFYYAPTLIAFRTDMNRTFSALKNRDLSNNNTYIPTTFQKNFIWNRVYDVKYNLSSSIKLEFSANNSALIDEPDGWLTKDSTDRYREKRDSVINNIKNFGRNTHYHHDLRATWTTPINKLPGFDWTSLTANYQAAYDWDKGLEPVFVAATDSTPADTIDFRHNISNSRSVQLNAQLDFKRLYSKSGYLKRVNQRFTPKGRKPSNKEQREVTSTKTGIKIRKNLPKVFVHNLGTTNVTIKVTDNKGVEVKGKLDVISPAKVRFTPDTDGENCTILIKGTKNVSDNLFVIASDYFLYAVMGLQSISGSVRTDYGTFLPGYMHRTRFIGMETDGNIFAPGVDYLFGFQPDDFPAYAAREGWLVGDSTINTPSSTSKKTNIDLRATWVPINTIKIDFSFNRSTSEEKTAIWFKTNDGFAPHAQKITGNFRMSYNCIKTSFWKIDKKNYKSKAYDNFLKNRLVIAQRLADKRYEASQRFGINYNPNEPNLMPDSTYSSEYPNGYSGLNQEVMTYAFLSAFSDKSPDKIAMTMFPTIPLPNWRVTYNGLSNLPLIDRFLKSVNITHGYVSSYNVGSYQNNPYFVKDESGFSWVREELYNTYFEPENIVSDISISEQYAPLIGIDFTWVFPFSTKIEFKRTRNLRLSFSNNTITETYGTEYVFGVGYKISELPIGIRVGSTETKFKSDLNLRADLTLRDDYTVIRKIEENFTELTNGTKSITIRSTADYALNDRFNLQLFYDQIINEPRLSTSWKTSNANIGISIRFTLIP